jgi:hypothetical protein
MDGLVTAGALWLLAAALVGGILWFAPTRAILDQEGLSVRTWHGRYTMRWDDVQAIAVLPTYRTVVFYGDGKRYRVSAAFVGKKTRARFRAMLDALVSQRQLVVHDLAPDTAVPRVWSNGVTLLCLLLLGPLLVPALYSLEMVAERWYVRSLLAQNAQTTRGTIVDHRFVPSENDPTTVYVTFQFDAVDADGVAQTTTGEQSFDPDDLSGVAIGAEVPIVYAVSDRSVAQIAGTSDFLFGAVILAILANGSVLLIVAWLAFALGRARKRIRASWNNPAIG